MATLSTDTISAIQGLAPVVQANSEAICQTMYDLLFEETPEARCFFALEYFRPDTSDGEATQATCPMANSNSTSTAPPTSGGLYEPGISRQAHRLAASIVEYCINIDDIDILTGEVRRIAGIHVSRGVLPSHYSLVGVALLDAIKKVLGDAATDDIIDAFGEAYEVLMDVFIEEEAMIRVKLDETSGGWNNFREFSVTDAKEQENGALEAEVQPVDGLPVMGYQPGQAVSVRWEDKDQGPLVKSVLLAASRERPAHHRRSYFFSCPKASCVSQEPCSLTLLHNHIRKGLKLELSAPFGGYRFSSRNDLQQHGRNFTEHSLDVVQVSDRLQSKSGYIPKVSIGKKPDLVSAMHLNSPLPAQDTVDSSNLSDVGSVRMQRPSVSGYTPPLSVFKKHMHQQNTQYTNADARTVSKKKNQSLGGLHNFEVATEDLRSMVARKASSKYVGEEESDSSSSKPHNMTSSSSMRMQSFSARQLRSKSSRFALVSEISVIAPSCNGTESMKLKSQFNEQLLQGSTLLSSIPLSATESPLSTSSATVSRRESLSSSTSVRVQLPCSLSSTQTSSAHLEEAVCQEFLKHGDDTECDTMRDTSGEATSLGMCTNRISGDQRLVHNPEVETSSSCSPSVRSPNPLLATVDRISSPLAPRPSRKAGKSATSTRFRPGFDLDERNSEVDEYISSSEGDCALSHLDARATVETDQTGQREPEDIFLPKRMSPKVNLLSAQNSPILSLRQDNMLSDATSLKQPASRRPASIGETKFGHNIPAQTNDLACSDSGSNSSSDDERPVSTRQWVPVNASLRFQAARPELRKSSLTSKSTALYKPSHVTSSRHEPATGTGLLKDDDLSVPRRMSSKFNLLMAQNSPRPSLRCDNDPSDFMSLKKSASSRPFQRKVNGGHSVRPLAGMLACADSDSDDEQPAPSRRASTFNPSLGWQSPRPRLRTPSTLDPPLSLLKQSMTAETFDVSPLTDNGPSVNLTSPRGVPSNGPWSIVKRRSKDIFSPSSYFSAHSASGEISDDGRLPTVDE